MKILLLLLLIPTLALGQAGPPPPPQSSNSSQDFGNTQNNIMGAQSRSFGGGSIIKPNQILNSADFTLVGSPTYEEFTFRPGTSLRLNTGASVTRVWEPIPEKDFTLGAQVGVGVVANGKSTDKDAYFVAVPYVVLLAQKEFKVSERITTRPEAYVTMCSPYYDIGMNFFSTSSTFNAVVGNCVGIKVSKKFRLNLTYRGNMNTTPKWGLMHNILIGSTLKF